jgi:glucose/arabinose dehydrogenase
MRVLARAGGAVDASSGSHRAVRSLSPAAARVRLHDWHHQNIREIRMRTTRHSTTVSLLGLAAVLAACSSGGYKNANNANNAANDTTASANSRRGNASKCAGDNTGLTLPDGFCATVFADSVGPARHLVVAPNGVVYVTLETMKPSTEKQIEGHPQPYANAGVAVMRDANGDGKADSVAYFGERGETGIDIFNNQLYVDQQTRIVRYALDTSALAPKAKPVTIISGIPGKPGHVARNFTIDGNGVLYLNVGSSTNACQPKDRQPDLAGQDPCRELATRAGVFRFDAKKTGQTFSPAARFATGLRNGMGLRVNPNGGQLWATQHGRDGLFDYWKSKFPDPKYQAENPAEELVQVNQNDDFGWPYCYWAVDQKKLVDAPEYGGDGKKTDRCNQKKEPVATYGGHWAPMSLFFYTGTAFPDKYKNGAFIAFHGSWNRAPEQQAPGRVVFQPLDNNGKSGGDYQIFAEGFAQVPANEVQPGTVKHRPVGVAQGPDGSIYISDDLGGRIWRITYNGGK